MFKLKLKFICLFIFVFSLGSLSAKSEQLVEQDTVGGFSSTTVMHQSIQHFFNSSDALLSDKEGWATNGLSAKQSSFNRYAKMSYVGASLIVGGLLVKPSDHRFQSLRNDFAPHFKNGYDDYIQYLPIATMFGMKALGVKGRSSWGRMLVSDAF